MDYLDRFITGNILKSLKKNKVLVLLGARRTGKTVLIQSIMRRIREKILLLNGEDIITHDLLRERSVENYRQLLAGYDCLIIDEAQKIDEIGLKLKLIVDHINGIRVLVTGSSSFDISNKLGEPLTGRSQVFHLYPFSEAEYQQTEGPVERSGRLEQRMVYGNYPELLHIESHAEMGKYLHGLVNSYLLKDILTFEGIRNASVIIDLLRLIAFQIGKEVSVNELSRALGIHKATVVRYLDLLSKVFIIFPVRAFSRNLRKEVSKSQRWYFTDNGIRNTVINNLNPLNQRNDRGMVWENYAISERVKYQGNTGMLVSNFFWRTYHKQEIDWIEEREGRLYAWEIKWDEKRTKDAPSAWKEAYPESEFQVIHRKNFHGWVT